MARYGGAVLDWEMLTSRRRWRLEGRFDYLHCLMPHSLKSLQPKPNRKVNTRRLRPSKLRPKVSYLFHDR